MEVNDVHSNDIPRILRDCMLFRCRVYNNAKRHSEFILTGGRQLILYEIQHGNILCSCNFTELGYFKGYLISNIFFF